MILGLLGVALLVLGIRSFVRLLPARGAVDVPGVVVEVATDRTSRTTSRSRVYRPTVEFRHPETGRTTRYAPEAMTGSSYEVGDTVTVAWDPATDTGRLRSLRRRRDDLALSIAGLGMIGFAAVDLLG